MKKGLILMALSLAVAVPSMAQMKSVKQAERIAKDDKPDYKMARSIIEPTLTNEETKNETRAWYVAGLIEQKQVEESKTAMALGKQYDEPTFYTALNAMVKYYLVADSLDCVPNEKGKVKRKYADELSKALSENSGFLVNAGSYYLDRKEFDKAHASFQRYLALKKLPMFEGTPMAAQDSMSMQIGFFSAYTASQMENNHAEAIKEYEAIKEVPYRQSDVYQLLAQEYLSIQDSVNYMATLESGAKVFPEDKFFVFNLINIYIRKGESEKAKNFLDQAIANDPKNVQLYNVLGTVYEQSFKDPAKAEEQFRKALEIDPTYADAVIGLGRIYYNQAVEIQSEANALNDQKKFDELNKKAKELFTKALPYFEKAVELQPDNSEYLMALRGIYYNLGMDAKVAEIEKKMNM